MSLPITVDPSSKKVSLPAEFLEEVPADYAKNLESELEDLNTLYRSLLDIPGEVPPVPGSVSAAQNKTLNAQIIKMRDSGIQAHKQKRGDAGKLLSLALEMSFKRPLWEPCGPNIEEVASIIAPRADYYIAQEKWPEAYADAAILVLLKPNDSASHLRKARCLQAIKKYDEAKKEYSITLAISPGESKATKGLKECEEALKSD